MAEFDDKLCAIEEERFGTTFPDREVSNICFKEKPFGDEVKSDEELCESDVVSLALFDGDCAGMLTNIPNLYFVILLLLLMI